MMAAIVWMAAIFGLSALSGDSVPSGPPALGHFVLYTILGVLCYVALPEEQPLRRLVFAVALASLYGVTDEFHQSFVPGRVPDVMDWVVDTAGATLGAFTMFVLASRKQNRRRA